jgi:BCD family chlorophyll transporter-like MFS transporter
MSKTNRDISAKQPDALQRGLDREAEVANTIEKKIEQGHARHTEAAQTAAKVFVNDVATALPLRKVLQICSLQVATAIAYVLINSTLNRVMVVEFGIQAWIVGVLIGFHNLLAFVRPVIGHYSDNHLIFGFRRTPNILVGKLITVTGVIGSVYGAVLMQSNFALGLTLSLVAFILYGIGVNVTGTMYFALLADTAGEKHKSKAVIIGWFILIIGSIFTSAMIGKYLQTFNETRLIEVFWIGGASALVLAVIATLGTEKRYATDIVKTESSSVPFANAIKLLVADKSVYHFFIFMFVTVISIQGQDVILEPYGAEIFGMSVSETTKLTQTWGVGTMVGILLFGAFALNRIGKKNTTYIGCAASALAFVVMSFSASTGSVNFFKSSVFLLGLGNGALTVGSLTLMMDMTTAKNAGFFMGLWGMAQAIANFLANSVGGGIRDISLYLTGDQVIGYTTAFYVEVAGLLLAIWVLRGIDLTAFHKKSSQMLSRKEDVVAVAVSGD